MRPTAVSASVQPVVVKGTHFRLKTAELAELDAFAERMRQADPERFAEERATRTLALRELIKLGLQKEREQAEAADEKPAPKASKPKTRKA